jgi:hypothetical protein
MVTKFGLKKFFLTDCSPYVDRRQLSFVVLQLGTFGVQCRLSNRSTTAYACSRDNPNDNNRQYTDNSEQFGSFRRYIKRRDIDIHISI